MKIALIGGSFNPPTATHGLIGTEILRLGLVDEVWYVPSNTHPFAGEQKHKANRATFRARCDMVMGMLEDLKDPRLLICLIETETPDGYTKSVLSALQGGYPQHEFRWVTGTDCVKDFPKWKHIEWVLENTNLIVYPRQGYPYTGGLDPKHTVLDETQVKVGVGSSSAVRDGDLSLLTPSVARYWANLKETV